MEQPLWTQGSQFLLSLPFGLALGLFYDLLRGLRRYARWMTHLLDALFVVNYLLANLLFALYIGGGEFRIFMLLGSLLGV
ncbi:MAG: spore cortex biosynthesis protein YabQ, partial [Oscillospiraceae bacterium]|nr:spore cortex biosynthesis protein YabQ [Oscillospiraceae bacterium]